LASTKQREKKKYDISLTIFFCVTKVLELAKQHDKASEIEKVQRYQMPSEKGELLHSFLEEEEKEKRAGYEQKKWEEEHLQQATLKFGAKDAKTRHQAREITVASVGDPDHRRICLFFGPPGSGSISQRYVSRS
jgi:hypothetical protein